MSKTPYPIKRETADAVEADFALSISPFLNVDKTVYCFTLFNPEGRCLAEAFSNSPFAPQWLRQQQAVLNTHHVLDDVVFALI